MDNLTNVKPIENVDSFDALFEQLGSETQSTEPTEVTVEQLFETPPAQEQETPQVITPPAVETPTTNPFLERTKFLLADGFWNDYEIPIINEKGEEQFVAISELSDSQLNEDLFEQIKAAQKEEKDKELKEKYISVEGIDDTTKKIIELKRKGGDITEALTVHQQYISPLEGVDLSEEAHQEWLVRQKLQMNPDLDADDIENKIKKLKANLVLDKEAEKIYGEIKTQYDKFLESKVKEQEDLIAQEKEQQKLFKKTITESARQLDIKNDNTIRSIVEFASKPDENGLSEADKKFFDIKQTNPELFTKVSLLLNNEELFNQIYGAKVATKVKTDTIRNVLQLKPVQKGTLLEKEQPKSKEEDIFDKI